MFINLVTAFSKIPTDIYCILMVAIFIIAMWYFHRLPKKYSGTLTVLSRAFKIEGDIHSKASHAVEVLEKEIEKQKKLSDPHLKGEDKLYFLNLLEKIKSCLYNGDFSSISEVVNYDTIIAKHGYRSFAGLMPGIFTGLGILGTFLGLVGGLKGLDFSNPSALEGGMNILISGMYLAFVTSVVGIVLSISWSIIDKNRIAKYKSRVDVFNNMFEKYLEKPKLHDFLAKILELEEEQRSSINTLASDISLEVQNIMQSIVMPQFADALVKVLDDGVVSKIDQSFGKVLGEVKTASENSNLLLEKFVDTASANQIEGLNKIVQEFINNMNSALEGRFEALAHSIDEMISWQSSMTNNVGKLLADIADTSLNIKEINSSVEDTILRFSNYFDKVNNANEKLIENINLIESTSQNIAKFITEASQIFKELNEEKGLFETQKDNYVKLMESYTAQVSQKISELQQNWNQVSKNLYNLNSSLQQSMGEFGEKTHSSLKQSFEIFDRELAVIARYLDGTISEIRSSVAELPLVISEFKKSLDVAS